MYKKVLHLSLKKEPFEVMVTGEKDCEYRKPTKWMKSRLFNKDGTKKHYDVVKFTNGYGNDKPCFIAEYKGFAQMCGYVGMNRYSNGFTYELVADDFVIYLGKIGLRRNINSTKKTEQL